jgi:phosphoglycolate phosphatase-like HAD superfamily hydrolase
VNSQITLAVLDLDNTLYDWNGYYVPSFLAMVEKLSHLSGVDAEVLKRSFKRVHEHHKCTEYAFAIEELDALDDVDQELTKSGRIRKYGAAIEAFRAKRAELLRLYEGVDVTLQALKDMGIKIAGLTDATAFYGARRLRQLGIEKYFDILCAPKDHGLPHGITADEVRSLPDAAYLTTVPILMEESVRRKPDTNLLLDLIRLARATPHTTIVVGDSLLKDIKMAQDCGAWDVFAAYGARIDKLHYSELLKITYWTAEDVAKLERLRTDNLKPTFSIEKFPDLLDIVKTINLSLPKKNLTMQ